MQLYIDNRSGAPIYDQIYSQIKDAILSGQVAEGEALPASDEPPVEKNLTHGRFEAVGPIEEKTVALPDGTELPEGLDILHRSAQGHLHTLIAHGDAAEVMNRLSTAQPQYLDVVPLTLEEIFIYELGGADYAVKDILL